MSSLNIGPLIKKNQNFSIYKKDNSEFSLPSEPRERIQILDKETQQKSLEIKPKHSSFFLTLLKTNNKNKEIKDVKNIFQFIKNKVVVNKFISNLFRYSYVLPQRLKPFPESEYVPKEIFKNTQQLTGLSNVLKVFQPGNQILMYWDMMSMVINMMSLWLCPFQEAFNYTGSDFLYIIIILQKLIDILVNLNRSTISKGDIIRTRYMILRQYFSGDAIYDIISFFIWIKQYTSSINFNYQDLLALIQTILTIKKVLTNFDQFFESLYTKGIFTGLTDLISLIVSVSFFTHIMACIWFYIGVKGGNYFEATWLRKLQIENEQIFIQYNFSIYWATTTIVQKKNNLFITVGYGDITPQNWIEINFTTIMMLVSSFVYAYSLNQIGNILKSFQDRKQNYKKTLFRMNNFMDQNKVELELQLRAKNFLRSYILENDYIENKQEMTTLMLKFPDGLRNCITQDIQYKNLQQFRIFKNIFTPQILKEVSNILEEINLAQQEIVFQQNEHSDPNLYYVYSGKIMLYEKESKKTLITLAQGQRFGEYQFFTGLFPKCSAQSMSNSILFKISREKLVAILKYSEKDFQRFCQIKDQILFYQNYNQCFANCQFCQKSTHEIIDCPQLTYQPDLEQKIKKNSFQESYNYRQSHFRKHKKVNSKVIQQEVNFSVKCYYKDQEVSDQLTDSNQQLLENRPLQNESYESRDSKEISGQLEQPYPQSQKTYQRFSQNLLKPVFQVVEKRNSSINQKHNQKLQDQNLLQTEEKLHTQQNLLCFPLTYSLPKIKSVLTIHDNFCSQTIDQIKEFKDYMPYNNISFILKKQLRRRNKKDSPYSPLISKYSFSYQVNQIGTKMRNSKQKVSDHIQN